MPHIAYMNAVSFVAFIGFKITASLFTLETNLVGGGLRDKKARWQYHLSEYLQICYKQRHRYTHWNDLLC